MKRSFWNYRVNLTTANQRETQISLPQAHEFFVIDQAWRRDGCVLVKVFFWRFLGLRRTRLIFSPLDRTSLFNKGFITWDKRHHFTCGTHRAIPSKQASRSILSARAVNHSVGSWFILPTRRANHAISGVIIISSMRTLAVTYSSDRTRWLKSCRNTQNSKSPFPLQALL